MAVSHLADDRLPRRGALARDRHRPLRARRCALVRPRGGRGHAVATASRRVDHAAEHGDCLSHHPCLGGGRGFLRFLIRHRSPSFKNSHTFNNFCIFPLVTERSSALAAYGDGSPPAAAISATFSRTSSVVNAGRRSYRPSAQRYSIERFLPSIYPLSVSPWRNALTNLLKPGHKLFRAVTRT